MARGDRGDPLLLRLSREIAWRPVGDRHAELRWRLAGQRDDLRELFGRELRRAAALRLVTDDVQNERLKIVVADALRLSAREQSHVLREALAPTTDALAVDAERGCHVDTKTAVGRAENDARSLDDSMLRRRGARDAFKNLALLWRKNDDRCVLWHVALMIRPIAHRNHSDHVPA